MKKAFARVMVIMLLLFLWSPYHSRAKAYNTDLVYEIITGVNSLRAGLGLSILQVNEHLMAAAQFQADYAASICLPTHDGPDKSWWDARNAAFGYGNGSKISTLENITAGEFSPAELIVAWHASDAHNWTMIRPEDTDIGAGIAVNCGWNFYVLEVGHVIQGQAYDGPPTMVVTPTEIIVTVIPSTPRDDGAIFHVVQPGETVWSIALLYGVSGDQVRYLNGIKKDMIYVGQRLIIRLPSTPANTDLPTLLPTLKASVETSTPLQPSSSPSSLSSSSKSQSSPFVIVSVVLGTLLVFAIIIIIQLATKKNTTSTPE